MIMTKSCRTTCATHNIRLIRSSLLWRVMLRLPGLPIMLAGYDSQFVFLLRRHLLVRRSCFVVGTCLLTVENNIRNPLFLGVLLLSISGLLPRFKLLPEDDRHNDDALIARQLLSNLILSNTNQEQIGNTNSKDLSGQAPRYTEGITLRHHEALSKRVRLNRNCNNQGNTGKEKRSHGGKISQYDNPLHGGYAQMERKRRKVAKKLSTKVLIWL